MVEQETRIPFASLHHSVPSDSVNTISRIHYIKWVLTTLNGFFIESPSLSSTIFPVMGSFPSIHKSNGDHRKKRAEHSAWLFRNYAKKKLCSKEKIPLRCVYFICWCTAGSRPSVLFTHKQSFPLKSWGCAVFLLRNIHLKSKHLILRINNGAHYYRFDCFARVYFSFVRTPFDGGCFESGPVTVYKVNGFKCELVLLSQRN